MLKVAYISPIYFSNVDIPYLSEMQKHCSIDYYALVGPDGKGCAIDLDRCPDKSGIYEGNSFHEVRIFEGQVDTSKIWIVYRKPKRSWSVENFKVTMDLFKRLQRGHYDVIHVTEVLRYYEWPLFYFRGKMVMSVHDPFLHSSMWSKVMEFYHRTMYRLLSHFILFNHEQKEKFITTYHLERKNIFVSSLSKYSYLTAFPQSVAPKYRYALFFGKIRGYKGLEYLFPAMEAVHAKHPDYKLVVAGSGEYYFDISKYKDCTYIEILNRFFKDSELASLLAHADFIVCPYNDATQSGVVMAAYAFDKPCIVTRTGGLPEMVGEGEYGIIVPPRNEKELTNAMCRMIEDPGLTINYSQMIHQKYSSGKLSWQEIANDLFNEVYSKI